ncbi:maleylacetoacetate isomerase [Sphingobium sp. AP50]|uniref:maleylacetoacetate isomerase n=1 Tax=Sphingobium sp. AP50 TaxID=1884369 RepID=UPI0008BD284C|nr:maleylacetoacetate isomerase [Sphingobium sp. AP50]SEJ73755.1 maleylacetoacetate isomerase [Sphingobium sp. AP50]
MRNLILHGYWRSSAAYRVRIALNLKGVAYSQVNHDLRIGAQRAQAYRTLAPHGLVPALQHDETVLIESPAILEWIEERWPAPPLLPDGPDQRATVRAMAALIGCDIHPLNNLRVLNEIKARFQAEELQVRAWIHRWILDGFAALEALIGAHGGLYAFGDSPTLADCYLVPQLYSARRFDVDLKDYPHLIAAGEAAARLPAVVAAHPDHQPDADV